MKTLSTLIATSVLLIGATAANADYYEAITSEKIATGMTDSRAEAQEAGMQRLSALESASPSALSNEFGLKSPRINESTINVDEGAYVTVEPTLTPEGGVAYIGVVNAGVSYEVTELDN
ncbi:DUF3316 domain-containing protein [Leucothrix sargassi]|nr:DUF3316 domain-containing protein [Leucothrix sargassi]